MHYCSKQVFSSLVWLQSPSNAAEDADIRQVKFKMDHFVMLNYKVQEESKLYVENYTITMKQLHLSRENGK